MVAVATIQDTTQPTSALQQAIKPLEPYDGGEHHCVQRGADKRLMEKQRRLNRFLGKLNDWEQAHKHVAYHDENKSRTRESSSEGNSRRSQDLESIHQMVPGIPITRVFSWARCECMKNGIPVPKTDVRDKACVRMAANIAAKRIQTAWKQHKRKQCTLQILSDDLRRRVVDELPVASHITKTRDTDPEKCKTLLTPSSNLADDSTDGYLSSLVASLGSVTPPISPATAKKPARTAKVTVATAPRFHTEERSRSGASKAAKLKQDINSNPVSKAEAALLELWRMEGIEIPSKMAYTTKEEASSLVDRIFPLEQEQTLKSLGQQPGLTWSKAALNRQICDSGIRDQSNYTTPLEDESATKGSRPSAIPIEAVAREHDPPMSTAMMAVLKRRADGGSRQTTPTTVAAPSSQPSAKRTSATLQSHYRKTSDWAAYKSQKNPAIARTAGNSKNYHPSKIWPNGHRAGPTQLSESRQVTPPTTASSQQTLPSTRGDTEKTSSGSWADFRQVHETGNRLSDPATKACNAESTPQQSDDARAVNALHCNKQHTQASQIRGQMPNLMILGDKKLDEPVAGQSLQQQDLLRKATNDPAYQMPGPPSHARTFGSSSPRATPKQRRASTGDTFPISQVTIFSSTAKSHSTLKKGASTTIWHKNHRWSVDSGSTALVQIQAMEASSSNVQRRTSCRRSSGGLRNSTSVSTSSKVTTEGKRCVVSSTQQVGGMPWTPMRSRK